MAAKTRKKLKRSKSTCYFCMNEKTPSYKDYEELQEFVSDRGKILSGFRTGVCSKHQRGLTRSIKRARHLGLLPFTPTV